MLKAFFRLTHLLHKREDLGKNTNSVIKMTFFAHFKKILCGIYNYAKAKNFIHIPF